jgi:hypothetical protein
MNTRLVCFLLAGGMIGNATGQEQAPVLRPSLGGTADLSPEAHRLYGWYDSLLTLEGDIVPSEQALFDSLFYAWGETYLGPCATIGLECSWYCGGGPDTLWASSTLKAIGPHSYEASNAHDLDRCTAWAEGVPGPGSGESLTYRFAPDSPRLHTVNISNGLVTSERAWRANNRVKRLRMDENDVPVAILMLQDCMADQSFQLPRLLGRRADGMPMHIRFTILEVYPGDRHDDTVISEIWFDGTDVH